MKKTDKKRQNPLFSSSVVVLSRNVAILARRISGASKDDMPPTFGDPAPFEKRVIPAWGHKSISLGDPKENEGKMRSNLVYLSSTLVDIASTPVYYNVYLGISYFYPGR